MRPCGRSAVGSAAGGLPARSRFRTKSGLGTGGRLRRRSACGRDVACGREWLRDEDRLRRSGDGLGGGWTRSIQLDSRVAPPAAAGNVESPQAEPPGWPRWCRSGGLLFNRKCPTNLRLPGRRLLTKNHPGRTQEENSHSQTHYSGLRSWRRPHSRCSPPGKYPEHRRQSGNPRFHRHGE